MTMKSSFVARFSLLVTVIFALAACGRGEWVPDGVWLSPDDPEFIARLKICTDIGMTPIVEVWGDEVTVAGCK